MGFVVMSQVLLILEHLVAVFALKCVIVLKDCLQTPKKMRLKIKKENLMTLFVSLSVRNRVKDDPTKGATVSHSFMWGLINWIMMMMMVIYHDIFDSSWC